MGILSDWLHHLGTLGRVVPAPAAPSLLSDREVVAGVEALDEVLAGYRIVVTDDSAKTLIVMAILRAACEARAQRGQSAPFRHKPSP